MKFSDFVGCDALVKRLRDGVSGTQGFAHAYLFSGPEGTGKRSMAAICARALNCRGAARPCDACPSCGRYLAGTHPDHHVLQPEKNKIRVDAVRDLIESVSLRPYEGGRHTVIIEGADSMNAQAQNALLKTLENPPGETVFFLIATRASALLPTILSRVRLIRFEPVSDEAVSRALAREGIAPERVGALCAIAQGSVGAALALNADKEYWALRERVVQALSALKTPGNVADCARRLKDDKDRQEAALGIMEQLAVARMRAAESGEILSEAVCPASIALDGGRLLQGLVQTRKMLFSNVSWQSALEMLFFTMVGG